MSEFLGLLAAVCAGIAYMLVVDKRRTMRRLCEQRDLDRQYHIEYGAWLAGGQTGHPPERICPEQWR